MPPLELYQNVHTNPFFFNQKMPPKSLLTTLTHKQITQIQAHILKSPKPHTLNKLLTSFTNSPTPQNALSLYNQMLSNPISHNHFTFTLALKACSLSHAHHKGHEIHAHLLKTGHFYDTFIQNSLIHFYVVVENDILSACRVFGTIAYPDVVSWTSIISGFSKCGFQNEAIVWFSLMDVNPNANTLVSVMSACSSLRELKLGKAVHCYGLKNFGGVNVILDNAVLDFYVKCGSVVSAKYLFVKMPTRDVVSWSSMVGGLVGRGFCKDAVRVFEEMVKGGEAVPNEVTIVNVLAACASLGSLSLGQWVHSYVNTRWHGLLEEGNVGNALINMYVKCGNVGMAVCVFYTIKWKDVVSWSTMISGLAMNGYGKHAFPLFSLMLVHGVCPDDVTFIGLLSACSHSGLVNQGLMLYKSMIELYGIVPRVQHCACMVDLYGRAGMLEEAEGFIRDMHVEADATVWGALLNACRIHGKEDMFERISRSLPSAKALSTGTFALLSNTYASSDRWDEANEVRNEMTCMGMKKIAGCSWIEVGT